jgi:hypothetical protein
MCAEMGTSRSAPIRCNSLLAMRATASPALVNGIGRIDDAWSRARYEEASILRGRRCA